MSGVRSGGDWRDIGRMVRSPFAGVRRHGLELLRERMLLDERVLGRVIRGVRRRAVPEEALIDFLAFLRRHPRKEACGLLAALLDHPCQEVSLAAAEALSACGRLNEGPAEAGSGSARVVRPSGPVRGTVSSRKAPPAFLSSPGRSGGARPTRRRDTIATLVVFLLVFMAGYVCGRMDGDVTSRADEARIPVRPAHEEVHLAARGGGAAVGSLNVPPGTDDVDSEHSSGLSAPGAGGVSSPGPVDETEARLLLDAARRYMAMEKYERVVRLCSLVPPTSSLYDAASRLKYLAMAKGGMLSSDGP